MHDVLEDGFCVFLVSGFVIGCKYLFDADMNYVLTSIVIDFKNSLCLWKPPPPARICSKIVLLLGAA